MCRNVPYLALPPLEPHRDSLEQGSLKTEVSAVWNEGWDQPLDPAGTAAHWQEPFSSCNATTVVILRARSSASFGGVTGHSAALWGDPHSVLT